MNDKDSLHINEDKLVVYYNGKPALKLNKELLDQQNCWANLEEIKKLHQEKLKLFETMKNTNDNKLLKNYDSVLTELEYKLQELWKFSKNSNYHKFWERPKCKCPKIDNYDAYPTGYYVVNESCPLHGGNK